MRPGRGRSPVQWRDSVLNKISTKTLRDAKWEKFYEYSGHAMSFQTFRCGVPGLTVTHERRKGRYKTLITYKAFGKSTDSLMQIVRWYNEEVQKRNGTGRAAAGSVEQVREKQRQGTRL